MIFTQLYELKNSTLEYLRSKNFADTTIKRYEYDFDCFINYAKSVKNYDSIENVFQQYFKENDRLYQQNKRTRNSWLRKRKACMYLYSFFDKKKISFSPINDPVFSPYYLEILDDISNIKGKSDAWKKSLKAYTKPFFKWLQLNNFETINIVNANTIKKYFLSCANRMTNKSLANTKHYLKTLFKFLNDSGLIESDFAQEFTFLIPVEKKMQHPVLQSTIAKVLSVIDRSTIIGKRDYAMIITATVTGLRQVDIVNIKLKDILWKKGEMNITQSKTGKVISLPLTRDYAEAILDYILYARPKINSEYLFLPNLLMYEKVSPETINRSFRRYCKICGIDSPSFHGVRRMLGSNMAMGGTRIDLIPDILGHSKLESIQPYISVETKGLKQCALSINELPPIEGGLNYV